MHKDITVQLSIELSFQGDLNTDKLAKCLFAVSKGRVTLTKSKDVYEHHAPLGGSLG